MNPYTYTQPERLAALAFYAGTLALACLTYQVVRPFAVSLTWAGVLAISFYPVHAWFERRLTRGRAALASTLAITLVVIVPVLFLASVFVSQASQVLDRGARVAADMPGFAQRALQGALRHVPGGANVDAAALLETSARRLTTFVSNQAGTVVHDALAVLGSFAVTMFALFFLFRDRASIAAGIRRVLPLPAELRERLITQTESLVTSNVTSALIVAAVQGILGALAFWTVGLAAPVFWGAVTALFCLLPIGAWVVWAPAAIWLMASGSVGRGLVLGALGLVIVSGADNVLRPILLSEHTKMNGLVLFISLVGGVMAFGSVGLVLGPVLTATCAAVFQTFAAEVDSVPPGRRDAA